MADKSFDEETFLMYYQLQYDKIETRRENFCNYVITISSAIFALGFTSTINLNPENFILLILFITAINLASIIFIKKSRKIIKMHQARAEFACQKYQKMILEINDKVGKENSENDNFRRSLIYSYIHSLIIILSIISIFTTGYVCIKLQNPINCECQ